MNTKQLVVIWYSGLAIVVVLLVYADQSRTPVWPFIVPLR